MERLIKEYKIEIDYIFQLTTDEKEEVVTNCDYLANLKYLKTLPYAFTELY